MSRGGDCCHYDDGYEDGYEDGKQAVPANAASPLGVAATLARAASELYRADPMSLAALDCEQMADAIIREQDSEVRHVWVTERLRAVAA